jgi:poly(A) polymerase
MILPPADWQDREGLAALADALDAASGAVRYVGGAVRDTLLGLPVSDLDLATIFPPHDVMARMRAAGIKAVPTGIEHGTITAILPGGPVEVTTLRRDVATDGRHAQVAFTADWRADAARRDFTINALFADPLTRTGFDYFGGVADLQRGVVRFIGDPLTRIAEDHLRILRFFRFHARFGRGAPDAASLSACIMRSRDLMALSRERIAQELLKLLAGADPVPTVCLMIDHAIFAPVLPEIDAEGGSRLAMLTAREGTDGDAIRRLAALLPPGPAIAESVAHRLKLSKAQRKRLMLAADTEVPSSARALAYTIGVEAARDRLLLRAGDQLLRQGLADLDNWQPPRLPLTGGTLIAMGLPAGPAVAATLQEVERRWVAANFPGEDDAKDMAQAIVAQRLRGED